MAFPIIVADKSNTRSGSEVTPAYTQVKKAFGGARKPKRGTPAAAFLKGLGKY